MFYGLELQPMILLEETSIHAIKVVILHAITIYIATEFKDLPLHAILHDLPLQIITILDNIYMILSNYNYEYICLAICVLVLLS